MSNTLNEKFEEFATEQADVLKEYQDPMPTVTCVNLLHFLHQTLVLLKFHSEEEQLRLLETEHLITGQRHSSMIKR